MAGQAHADIRRRLKSFPDSSHSEESGKQPTLSPFGGSALKSGFYPKHLWDKMGINALRSQIVTLKRGQHSKYLPFAFTEQGVAIVLDRGIHIQKAYDHIQKVYGFAEDITDCDILIYVCASLPRFLFV